MCGICGIIYKDNQRPAERALIERMTDEITHRGPDDVGYYLNGNVALGHRRLSIVDLKSGQQPMSNADQTLWIIYNGEVYNHLDLRPEIEKRGLSYRTNCDTETVLLGWQAYGSESLQRLRGMFAFALYDVPKARLSLVRDRLGIKPLYYVDTTSFFAFASEIKSLLQIDELKRNVDHEALLQILALKYTTDDLTLFSGVRKLLPGHYLELEQGTVSITKYYDFNDVEVDTEITETDAVEHFRELFDESVRLRLMADVPLGMFLSGGLDSSVISARMSKMVSLPISTFSVAFKEREANELYYARQAAEYAHANHHEVTMTPTEFFDLLPAMIYHEDEPVAHPSSVALHVVSRLAREHVKVVLTGEGSDELFGGYERYYQTLYNIRAGRLIPGILKKAAFRPLLDLLPYKFPYRNKAVRTSVYLDSDLQTIFLDNYATFSRAQLAEMLLADEGKGNNSAGVYDGFMRHFKNANSGSLLSRILYADIKTYLLELLMKQDQMSMAASIESRVPFLDHKIVEFAFTLPDHLKIKRFDTKRVLRLAFGDQIPPEILSRAKAGFPVPINRWFANEYHQMARDIVLHKDSFCSATFNRDIMKRYFDLHHQGKYNHSDRIWTLLNLELWHRIFIRHDSPESIKLKAS